MNLRFFVALGAAALLFVPDVAEACQPPLCIASSAPRGGNLPGNALAIPYRTYAGFGAGSATPTFRLVDGAGAEIATTVKTDAFTGGQLLVPSSALPAGKVDLVWAETCGDHAEMRKSFSVGSDVPLPTAAGTLKAVNRKVGSLDVNTSSGSCYNQVQAVTFDLTLDPSLELRAYREVTAYEISVDGQGVKWPYYGVSLEADDGPLTFATLHAVCSDRKAGDDNGPELGIRTVSVQAHIAGAASDPPPVRVNVNFSCTDATVPPAPTDPVPVAEPAVPRTPASSSSNPSDDSKATTPGSNAAPAPESSDGCNASPAQSGSPFALLALAAFAIRSRRRAADLLASREASRTK